MVVSDPHLRQTCATLDKEVAFKSPLRKKARKCSGLVLCGLRQNLFDQYTGTLQPSPLCRHETPKPLHNKLNGTEDETQQVSAHKEDDTLKAQISSSFHIQGAASLNSSL
ncbi:hypothetical protein Q8A67_023767 [Cirrhinus molitorella]|uniref:Uncharacterized protein n=1 Tax=Cirrhinus molitorella TaxID=172907 RepID=A0AA88P0H4_9TELE|nr:hypothetical protein Q8A67_023767 [Cirrhinus molitorella]